MKGRTTESVPAAKGNGNGAGTPAQMDSNPHAAEASQEVPRASGTEAEVLAARVEWEARHRCFGAGGGNATTCRGVAGWVCAAVWPY